MIMQIKHPGIASKQNLHMYILSWPPRSSTACTKRACSVVVHRILGALTLRRPGGNLDLDDKKPPPPPNQPVRPPPSSGTGPHDSGDQHH